MKKRNDLTGCKIIIGKTRFDWGVKFLDEDGRGIAGIHVPASANVSARFRKTIADALKAAIPEAKK